MSASEHLPLDGCSVLVCSEYLSAALCGQFLRWQGATVRLARAPGLLRLEPLVKADQLPPEAMRYATHGMTIVEAETLEQLMESALPLIDVVVTDLSAARLREVGLDPVRWAAEHPTQILLSLSGYGLTGPNADRPWSELTAYHAGGEGYLLPGDPVFSMFPDRPPVRGGRQLADYDLALAGLVGCLGALVGRARTGLGDVVEIAAQEVQIGLNRTTLSRCIYEGRDIDRSDRGYDYGGLLPCLDGWISLRPTEDRQWQSFVEAIGRHDLVADARYATRAARDRNGAQLTAELEAWSRQRSRADIREVLLASECPGGPFLEPHEVLEDRSLTDRSLFAPLDEGRAPQRLFLLHESRTQSPCAVPPLRRQGVGPLDGLKVLDLTWVAAGPYASALLRFMGADVIKVEAPDRPDLFRRLIEGDSGDLDSSIRFSDLNQGKRAISLDLKSPADREVFHALVTQSHLLVDNFRPGVRERLGIGDADLWSLNPQLACASLSGFGATGVMSNRPGYASVFNAESGLGSLTGYADGPPTEIRDSNDLRAGMAACAGALAALLATWSSGCAHSAEIAAREVLVTLQGDALLEASLGGRPSRRGNALGRCVPYGCYSASDGQWVALSVRTDEEWRALCAVVGEDRLLDDRFSDPRIRWDERDLVEEIVSAWVATAAGADIVECLSRARVPSSVSASALTLFADPHLRDRGLFVTAKHDRLGEVHLIGSPIRLWRQPTTVTSAAPLLDEHRQEVLSETAAIRGSKVATSDS